MSITVQENGIIVGGLYTDALYLKPRADLLLHYGLLCEVVWMFLLLINHFG